jgi:UDP-glucose 6-dehydrogenase
MRYYAVVVINKNSTIAAATTYMVVEAISAKEAQDIVMNEFMNNITVLYCFESSAPIIRTPIY